MLDGTYMDRVDEALTDLRQECLGQTVPLTCFGTYFLSTTVEAVSQRLLFALAAQGSPYTAEELQEIREWLQRAANYLLVRCVPAERTFGSLVRLRREWDILWLEVRGRKDLPRDFTAHRLEVAILNVLTNQGEMTAAVAKLRKLEELAREHPPEPRHIL